MLDRLNAIGWDDFFQAAWDERFANSELVPARIASSLRGAFVLWTADDELEAPARPRLIRGDDKLCTGDWVALRLAPAVVEEALPRKTRLVRKASGIEAVEQTLAANIDVIFLVQGLDRDFNPRRLERYLTIAWESGAMPVVVLNKADLCDDLDAKLEQTRGIARDAAVVPTCAATGEGVDRLRSYLEPGRTAGFIGSSGVGKSALTNQLAGGDVREVGAVRESDGRGKHTTVGRELIRTREGWLLMDLPGIREVQPMTDEGVEQTFPDVEELVAACRFNDCRHQTEPGCAVRAALEAGELDEARWRNYQRVQQELEILAQKQDTRSLGETKRKIRKMQYENRKRLKKDR